MSKEKEILSLIAEDNPADILDYTLDTIANTVRDQLNDHIKQCTACPISVIAKSLIQGDLKTADILVVSEHVTQEQAEHGYDTLYPFDYCKVQEPLQQVMNERFRPEKVAYANVVNCYPHIYDKTNNVYYPKVPGEECIKNCSVFLKTVITVMRPLYMIIMGNIALNALHIGKRALNSHGTFIKVSGVPAIITVTPHRIMENSRDAREQSEFFINDLDILWNKIKQDYPENYKELIVE